MKNPFGRFLERRRRKVEAVIRAREAEKRAAELESVRSWVDGNPKIHARILLQGKRGIHYLEPMDLFTLEAFMSDDPQMKSKFN